MEEASELANQVMGVLLLFDAQVMEEDLCHRRHGIRGGMYGQVVDQDGGLGGVIEDPWATYAS